MLALLRPLEALITSSASAGSTPAFLSAASPSAVDQMWIASSALFTLLSAWPAPTGPQCTSFSPKASSTSRTRAKSAASPPTITVSVAASAPDVPPLTGASRKCTPRAASTVASRRDVAGSPEVQSTNTVFAAIASRSPSAAVTTCSTSRELGRQVITTSASCAASAGVAATRQPCAFAKASAFSAVRFQTVS